FGRAVDDIGRNDGSRMETGHAGRVELPPPVETDNHLTPYSYGTDEE
ncbi:TraL conjugative transposon family protein, partial [Bacteroides fragilis]